MIKDIVVHFTGSDEDAVRLAYAAPVARSFEAHLTGLQVHALPNLISYTDPAGSGFLQQLLADSHAAAQKVSDALTEKLDASGVSNELRRLDVYPPSVGQALAAETRTADLFIGTRPYGDPTHKERIEEQVLFESGRPCLFVPPGGTPPKLYATVLVAWKETRESARAVADALPFLQRAHQVVVVLVEEEASEQLRVEAGADIGRYLSRHGVSAEIRKVGGWSSATDAILNEARQTAADMIVMGAYGHSRLREWALGGVTREVLGEATIPVLVSH